MRATSGSLARCRGRHPHYLSWLWSKFWPQNQVSLQAGINTNSFVPISDFFFQNSQKNWQKLKTYQKLLKMSENSKFCNFWAISTCNTSKESIFHIEFNFKQKKIWFVWRKNEKIKFFNFFFKIDAGHLSSNGRFSNLCQKIFKTEFACALERFWN